MSRIQPRHRLITISVLAVIVVSAAVCMVASDSEASDPVVIVPSFPDVYEGYDSFEPRYISALFDRDAYYSISLSSDSHFILSGPDPGTTYTDDIFQAAKGMVCLEDDTLSKSYKIQPKDGLVAGTYSVDVEVRVIWYVTDNPSEITLTESIVFTVKPTYVPPSDDWPQQYYALMLEKNRQEQEARETAAVAAAAVAAALVAAMAALALAVPATGMGATGAGLVGTGPLGSDPGVTQMDTGDSDDDVPMDRIFYKVDGGSDSAPPPYYGCAGDTVEVESYKGMKPGYTFVGWRCGDTKTVVKPGDIILAPVVPITLTAVWEED